MKTTYGPAVRETPIAVIQNYSAAKEHFLSYQFYFDLPVCVALLSPSNVKDQPSIRIGCIALLGSFLVFIVSENLRAKNPLPVTLSCYHIPFTGAGIAYF